MAQKPNTGGVKESELPPPPAYQQSESADNPTSTNTTPPKYSGTGAAIPLPTYDQSEKFEKDGVLLIPVSTSDSETSDVVQPVRTWRSDGTCLEFTLFFTVCAMFSVVGFIFSFCLATSTAAQAGAIAGLGTAFISKPLIYELYYRDYEEDWTKHWCVNYSSDTDLQKCMHWSTTTMRTIFFIVGVFGLVLLYKGFSAFFKSRGNK